MSMEIVFLGTSSGIPTKERNVSSIVVRYQGDYIFIDVGEGAQRQAMIAGIGLRKNIKIFITHMHGDHVLGLIPMIQTMSMLRREDPLYIYGPKGIKEFLHKNMEILDIRPTFKINIEYLGDNKIFEFKNYIVRSIKNIHSKYSYSILIEEKPRPGKFNPDLAIKDKIPVKFWKKLKNGEDIILNGKIIRHQKYVSPPYLGRKIVISGDTRPSNKLIKYSKNADILIHEATFASDKKERSIETRHSTATEAAQIAKKANVKILIITHFSARYEDIDILVHEAKKIFPATFAAEDFMRIDVPPSRKVIRI